MWSDWRHLTGYTRAKGKADKEPVTEYTAPKNEDQRGYSEQLWGESAAMLYECDQARTQKLLLPTTEFLRHNLPLEEARRWQPWTTRTAPRNILLLEFWESSTTTRDRYRLPPYLFHARPWKAEQAGPQSGADVCCPYISRRAERALRSSRKACSR